MSTATLTSAIAPQTITTTITTNTNANANNNNNSNCSNNRMATSASKHQVNSNQASKQQSTRNQHSIKQHLKKKGHRQSSSSWPNTGGAWKVKASSGALKTSNPIREIIETMNLAENPNKKVIPLSIGDPTIFGNLKPCREILDALQEANTCGRHYGYQTAAGMESARDAVVDYHFRCTGNRIKRQDVILASGCSHAIDLCICVLAQHGQNILIPRPGFPLYKTLTSVYGVEFKQYDLIAEKNWSIDLEHLECLIDDKTAAIIINNPSNPCGSVFNKRHLLEIIQVAEKYRLPIISDEIYDKFVFSPEFYSPKKLSQSKPMNHHCQKNTSSASACRRYSLESSTSSNEENCQPATSIMDDEGDENCISCREDAGLMKLDDDTSVTSSNDDIAQPSSEDNDNDYEEQKDNDGQVQDEGDDDDDEDNDNRDGLSYVPFRSLSTLSKTVPILTCGGISKTCLIPGLRLGWIIINDRANIFDGSIRNGLNRLTQRLMGPNSLVQGALHDILTNVPESFYKQTMDFIYKNAKLCYDRLKTVPGLHPFMPQGSMYLMVRFDGKSFPRIDGDLDFTSRLMNEESVLVLPGRCFDFPNYFRICLTVPTNVMEEALIRISEFCERHHNYTNVSVIVKRKTSSGRSVANTTTSTTTNHLQVTKSNDTQRISSNIMNNSPNHQHIIKNGITTTTATATTQPLAITPVKRGAGSTLTVKQSFNRNNGQTKQFDALPSSAKVMD